MSADANLFRPPKTYPVVPKNMYYEVPSAPLATDCLKPIFPWEENQAKPTRVFVNDVPPLSDETPSATTEKDVQTEITSPTTAPSQSSPPEPFTFYALTNAWDEMPEIERYIANVFQSRRGMVPVLQTPSTISDNRLSPSDQANPSPQRRRPSMKLTDFPTEIERPSLPVTPAPVRRPSFWGEERDAAGDLPSAEGVPDQSEWDPVAKLAELQRRQSEVLAQVPAPGPTRVIPDRKLPGSAPSVATAAATEPATFPSFGHLNFAGGGTTPEDEEEELALSPLDSRRNEAISP